MGGKGMGAMEDPGKGKKNHTPAMENPPFYAGSVS